MRFLITAGGTREYIDPVRFITNASSGKMGFALAQAALKAGHRVTLITTATDSKLKTRNSKLRVVCVETAAQMFTAVKEHFPKCDCLIMAAAVADYTPAHPSRTKLKKQNRPLTIKLKPTPDILRWAGEHKNSKLKTQNSKLARRRIVVGFALEDRNLRANAERKTREKHLDMIVANSLSSVGADTSTVSLKVVGCPWIEMPNAAKARIGREIIHLVQAMASGDRRPAASRRLTR